MDERELFVLADRTLLGVVNRIRTDQWSMTMPPEFMTRGADHPPTLREIINHHAYDDAWVPDLLAGRTMAEVGVDEHKGNLLGDSNDDHAGYFTAYDIAQVLSLEDQTKLPAALVQGIWDQVTPHAEEWRSYGVFPPAIPVPDDAPLQDRLLGLTGRRPDHVY